MSARVEILGCPVDNLTFGETVEAIDRWIAAGRPGRHCVVNAAKMVLMRRDPDLFRAVAESDLINADGQGVVWAGRLLGTPLKERVTGIDLMQALLARAEKRGWRVYFLGAREEIVRAAVEAIRRRHPDLAVAGFRNGYFSPAEEPGVVAAVREARPDLLLVALSTPMKELFIARNVRALSVPFSMGVGGSFDVVAGFVPRAPAWVQRLGLEWFYRFLQEPRRLWRRTLLVNGAFARMAVAEALRRRLGLAGGEGE